MTELVSIAKAIDYVEESLRQPITVADMAGSASYSVYHFCRMFNQVTHHPPYDYLMRRRLSESASALLRSDRKIIDIALEYQFNNPEAEADAGASSTHQIRNAPAAFPRGARSLPGRRIPDTSPG